MLAHGNREDLKTSIPENNDKHLSHFNITNGTILKCDDFLQNYNVNVIIAHK